MSASQAFASWASCGSTWWRRSWVQLSGSLHVLPGLRWFPPQSETCIHEDLVAGHCTMAAHCSAKEDRSNAENKSDTLQCICDKYNNLLPYLYPSKISFTVHTYPTLYEKRLNGTPASDKCSHFENTPEDNRFLILLKQDRYCRVAIAAVAFTVWLQSCEASGGLPPPFSTTTNQSGLDWTGTGALLCSPTFHMKCELNTTPLG